MKKAILLFITIIGLTLQVFSQPYPIPEKTKRILILGNSITYMGTYVSYIDTYLTLTHPDKQYEIINLGLPSETVSGLSEPGHADGKFPRPDLHERLDRILTQTHPDLVIACYGMNDGIYMPFDGNRFAKFQEGIRWLHDKIIKTGASVIFVTPPVFDERKGKAYANVLDLYSDWLISLRYTSQWQVIDIHWPMKKYLEDKRKADSSFLFAKDGIHPNATGHFIMAQQILLSLGENEIAKAVTIKDFTKSHPYGDTLLSLIGKRQSILKDAWLTQTGHKRPGMPTGLPMKEALQKTEVIDQQIHAYLKK